MNNDEGISELVDETLILALVVVTAGIVGIMVLGFAVPVEKTAYVVPQFGIKDVGGKMVITAFSRGGDPVYFNATPLASYKAAFYVDTALGSYRAEPAQSLAVFRPGDMVYLYYTGTGFGAVDYPPAGASVVTLPAGRVAVRLVDINSGTLISQEIVVPGPGESRTPTGTTSVPTATVAPNATTVVPTSTATVTATPAANVTPTATATPSPTATANVTPTATPTLTATATPTPTATTPGGTYGVTVSWSPPGLGTATLSPSTSLTNPQTVAVPVGSSPTFTFTPNAANKAILTVKLDGATVYTGSAKGTPVSVTIPPVTSAHTLAATFG